MRTLKHLVLLSLVVAVAVFLAAPSAFAKKALTEDELEMISAAGEPMIITADGSVSYSDTSIATLTLDGVQSGLNALSLNNVAGENQLATGLNIASAAFADNFVDQTNTITQSWGSTLDWTAVTIPSVPGSSPTCTGTSVVCVLLSGTPGIPGSTTKLTGHADVGITSGSDVTVFLEPVYTLTLSGDAQSALVALVVNNVAGMNQVATGVNILGGSVEFAPNLLLTGVGGTNHVIGTGQTNTINQFRGTPFSRP